MNPLYTRNEEKNTHIYSPDILSHNIRDVIMRPKGLNRASKSCCAIFFGKPETYKFAPLIASELGRA